MLYVLTGEDDFSIRRTLEEIKRGIGDQSVLAANTSVFGGKVSVEELRNACDTVPFLAEKRLVIAEGLLARFEPANRTGGKKTSRPAAHQGEVEAIVDCARHLPPSTVLVLVDGKTSGRNPLLRGLSSIGETRHFPTLKDDLLQQWIRQRVSEAGGSISPAAVSLLARYVGSNLWLMAGEVDKLVLFAGGRRVEEADVTELVSYAQEAGIFPLIDAILELKASVAHQLLQQLLKQGAAPAYILVMLSRQVQMMVRARQLRQSRTSARDMQERLGLSSDYVLRKVLERTARYSMDRLRTVYHQLLDADLSIKTGRYDGELALGLLIAELCQQPAASGVAN